MSDDFADGQRLASSNSSPDWTNQDQADGWRAQKLAEATRYIPPPESASTTEASSTEASSSWETPPSWQPAQTWGTSSPSWTPNSGSGVIAHPIRKRLTRLLIGPAAFAGGWIGYGYGQAHHWAGMQALAAAGGAALVSASLVPVGIYLVTEVLYTLKALALAIWWIAVKLFWLALIVGGIGWAISLVPGW